MEASNQQPLHERVRVTLARRGISGRKFARLVGVSQPYMSLFLHGKRVSAELAARIETALDAQPVRQR